MKIKKFISLLAATTMIVTAITGAMTVSAETDSGDCGEGVKWSFDSSTGKLTISGKGAMASPNVKDVLSTFEYEEVQSQLSDYPDVYTYKKEHMGDIKEVVIEEGVTSIGVCAFYKMPNLETVVLPSTISEFKGIGISARNRENSMAPEIDEYASLAFAECIKLKNLTLTEGITAIGAFAFYNCTSLESVKIPKSINNWGAYSFLECSSLKNITLPEGLTVMGGCAFEGTAVNSVVIPSTIEIWNVCQDFREPTCSGKQNYSCAFAFCENLSSVTFTEGLKKIEGFLFYKCTRLKRVSIPKSVTNMRYAFCFCTGLQEAYIEDGAQITKTTSDNSAFDYAFYYCENLKRLEIPSGVGIDYTNAQWNTRCSGLTDLYIHGQEYGYFPVGNKTSKVHCYFGTETYNSLIKNGAVGPRLADIEEDIENAQAELNKAVTEAEKYAEEVYTPESYGVLKALLEKAGKYGKDPSVMSMEDTTEGIYAAIDGLVDKSNEPSSDPSSSDPSDSSNPSDNSSDPSNSSGNNNQSQSPNTPGTPATSAPTTATPKPVTPPTVTTTAAKPAKVKNVKVIAKKKKLNVSWKKVSGATGYEVLSATNNKFTKNKKTVTVKKNKVTLKKLKPKKKYFVKVRAYKLANGNKYFGKWSKVVKKKTK